MPGERDGVAADFRWAVGEAVESGEERAESEAALETMEAGRGAAKEATRGEKVLPDVGACEPERGEAGPPLARGLNGDEPGNQVEPEPERGEGAGEEEE